MSESLEHTEMEAKGETDRLSEEHLKNIVSKPELMRITEKYCPSRTYAFWIPETEAEKTELEVGQEIRLKTKGDSPFICE